MVVKLSISLSEELTAVLDELARRRGDDRSPLIETLLRENPIVQEGVALWRKEAWTRPAPPPPGGRDDGGPTVPGVQQSVLDGLVDEAQRSIVALLARAPTGGTVHGISQAIGRSHATTARAMASLRDRGMVTEGSTPAHYILSTKAKAARSKEVPRGPVPP